MRKVVAILFLGLVGVGRAATLHVPSEYATINAALDASIVGDSVLVAPGTYSDFETRMLQGGGPFTASSIAFLKGGVSLIGEGGREVTTIDLASQGVGRAVPVLAYDPGPGTILVEGFTITGAPVGNAGMWSRSLDRMIVRDCTLEELDGGSRDAGGLYSLSADLEVYDSEFRSCRAGYLQASPMGAAILHAEGHAIVDGCLFAECEGPMIVSLAAVGVSPPFDALVRDCMFLNNVGLASQILSFVTLTVEGCAFVGNGASSYAGLVVSGGPGGIVEPGPYAVRRNLFAWNTPRAMDWDRVSGVIEDNTFVRNGERALTIGYEPEHSVVVRRNIVAFTEGIGIRFVTSSSAPPTSECNAFWANSGGDTGGFAPGPTDLFVDPQFCDEVARDYTLSTNSPCLPPNSGACGQIGAFGAACGGVAVEAETWARTKAKYRGDTNWREEP